MDKYEDFTVFGNLKTRKISLCSKMNDSYVCAGGFGEPPKIITQYMALHDNIIHHMRFPKFISIVSIDFDQDVSCLASFFFSFLVLVALLCFIVICLFLTV